MADMNDLAQWMYGKERYDNHSDSDTGAVTVLYGTALEDSVNGSVKVYIGNNVTNAPGLSGATVTLPTYPYVMQGETVIISLVGAGSAKHPYVSAVIGSGDRTRKATSQAKQDASQAKADAGAALAETKDLVTIRIDSSRGTVFKNNTISTALTVHCYKKGQEITSLDALRKAMGDNSAYIRWWVLREGETNWVMLDSSSKLLSNDGFVCTISPADVNVKCTFKAEIASGEY